MCIIEGCNLEKESHSNECILHSKKSKNSREITDAFADALLSYIEKNKPYDHQGNLILVDIVFPNFRLGDEGDFTKKLNSGINIEFRNCTFYGKFLGFKNFNCCFFNCTFLNDISISNMFNFNNTFLFVECVFEERINFLGSRMDSNLFNNCTFKKGIDGDEIYFRGIIFNKIKFFEGELRFNSSTIEKRLIMDNSDLKIEKLDLNETIFKNKVKLQFLNISNAYLNNTNFESLADFYGTTFKNIEIKRLKFKDMAVFTETTFKNNLDFKYVKFFDESIFREMEIKGNLNLRETSFRNKKSFLDAKINVKNRETARIIKDSFEQQNNIIEANRFYALEMKEREKELSWKNDFFEKLIFSFHGLSSNHSQNWLLPIFWIVFFGLLNSYFQPLNFYTMNHVDVLYKEFFIGLLVSLTTFVFLLSLIQHKIYYNYVSSFFIILFAYLVFTNDIYFSDFANSVNPFSIMTKGEELSFGILIYKIIIAYLIYQLIISIRQNTRRK